MLNGNYSVYQESHVELHIMLQKVHLVLTSLFFFTFSSENKDVHL